MPSSTSSSRTTADERLPAGGWGRTWLAAILIALAVLGAWELFWRGRGLVPTVSDNADLWAEHRVRVSDDDADTVVVLGSSVLQAAVDLAVWARETGGPRPVQLGLASSSPLPVLEDLAGDPDFAGVALTEMSPMGLFDSTETSHRQPEKMLDHYRATRVGPARRSEARLAAWVRDRAVFRVKILAPTELLRSLARGGLVVRGPMRMNSDRELRFDFGVQAPRVLPEVGRAARGLSPMKTGAALDAVVARIDAAVRAIQARGGQVVLVSLDCEGPYREAMARHYPLDRYWAALEPGTTARKVDLVAHPELRGIACPDGKHLEVGSRGRFTRVLVREVAAALDR